MRGEDDDGFGDVDKSSSGTTTPRPWVAVPAFMPAIGRWATRGFMAARACDFDGDAAAVDEPLEMRNVVRIDCVGSFWKTRMN